VTGTIRPAPEPWEPPWPEDRVPPTAGEGGRPGPLTLLIVLFTGPVVWAVHLAGSSALVGAACSRGATWSINALTVVCALLIAGAMIPAARLLRRHRPSGPAPDRVIALVAAVGLLWSAISLLVTVLEGIPVLAINACPV
jgi:hypothetical protein